MITYDSVTKRFRRAKRPALDRVTFSVERGECLGLLGPNGAGKSTLLNLVVSDARDFEGTIRIAGIDVRARGLSVLENVGFVPQTEWLDPYATVLFSMKFQARLHRRAFDPNEPTTRRLIRELGLEECLGKLVMDLSGGMQRRLSIALALVHDPEILVLDEPTNGLDAAARGEVWCALRESGREGLTILVSTHLLEEADRHCDRVVVLNNGAKVAEDRPSSLKATLGAHVVAVKLGDDRDPIGTFSALNEALSPLKLFHENGRSARFECPRDYDVRGNLRALVDTVEAVAGRDVTVSWSRTSLEDAYLRALGRAERTCVEGTTATAVGPSLCEPRSQP